MPRVAFVGELRLRFTVSISSAVLSLVMLTEKVWEVTPAENVSVPLEDE